MNLIHIHQIYPHQKHDMKRANRSFEIVAQLRYLEVTVTAQNLMLEKIKRRMNSGSGQENRISGRGGDPLR
jgi:hypothetical protein